MTTTGDVLNAEAAANGGNSGNGLADAADPSMPTSSRTAQDQPAAHTDANGFAHNIPVTAKPSRQDAPFLPERSADASSDDASHASDGAPPAQPGPGAGAAAIQHRDAVAALAATPAPAATAATAAAAAPFDPNRDASNGFSYELKLTFTSGSDLACSQVDRVPHLVAAMRLAALPKQRFGVIEVLKATLRANHEKVIEKVLASNVLSVFKKWLELLLAQPDSDDRSTELHNLLELLHLLPTTTEHMIRSQIGSSVTQIAALSVPEGAATLGKAVEAAKALIQEWKQRFGKGGGPGALRGIKRPRSPPNSGGSGDSATAAATADVEPASGSATSAASSDAEEKPSAPVSGGPAPSTALARSLVNPLSGFGTGPSGGTYRLGGLGSKGGLRATSLSRNAFFAKPVKQEADSSRAKRAAEEASQKQEALCGHEAETPAAKRQRRLAAGKQNRNVRWRSEDDGLEQVRLFDSEAAFPGWVDSAEASAEADATTAVAVSGADGGVAAAKQRHNLFKDAARQEHMNERSALSRTADGQEGSGDAVDAEALQAFAARVSWPAEGAPLLPVGVNGLPLNAHGSELQIARGEDSMEARVQTDRCARVTAAPWTPMYSPAEPLGPDRGGSANHCKAVRWTTPDADSKLRARVAALPGLQMAPLPPPPAAPGPVVQAQPHAQPQQQQQQAFAAPGQALPMQALQQQAPPPQQQQPQQQAQLGAGVGQVGQAQYMQVQPRFGAHFSAPPMQAAAQTGFVYSSSGVPNSSSIPATATGTAVPPFSTQLPFGAPFGQASAMFPVPAAAQQAPAWVARPATAPTTTTQGSVVATGPPQQQPQHQMPPAQQQQQQQQQGLHGQQPPHQQHAQIPTAAQPGIANGQHMALQQQQQRHGQNQPPSHQASYQAPVQPMSQGGGPGKDGGLGRTASGGFEGGQTRPPFAGRYAGRAGARGGSRADGDGASHSGGPGRDLRGDAPYHAHGYAGSHELREGDGSPRLGGGGRGDRDRDRDRDRGPDHDRGDGRGRGGRGRGRGRGGGRICAFWNTERGCYKGDDCPFAHVGEGFSAAREEGHNRGGWGRGRSRGGGRGRGRGWD